jgi:hypothetical protein
MTKEKLPTRLDGPGSGAGHGEILYGPIAAKRRKKEEQKAKRERGKPKK